MIVIPPLTVDASLLASSTAAAPYTFPTFDGAHTYGIGDVAGAFDINGDGRAYESLTNNNRNNQPLFNPNWWRQMNYYEAVWDAVTEYSFIGQKISYNDRMYSSLQAPNLNHAPLTSAEWWEDVGPTNKWAMFDTLRNTATFEASPLVVVVQPGERVNAVAVLGVFADSVRVQVSSLGVSLYDETTAMRTREVSTYSGYFFEPFTEIEATLFQGLPNYTDAVITVTFTKSIGPVRCGALVLGTAIDLGITESSPVNDALNFSTVEREFDGTAELIPRRTVPTTNQTVFAKGSSLKKIIAARTALNAVPAVWAGLTDSGSDYFPSLLILGFYRKFSITLVKPASARIALELEEV